MTKAFVPSRRRATLATAAVAVLAAGPAAADAATIYSDATAATGGSELATGSTYLTATFNTGSSVLTKLTASLLLEQVTAGSATVGVYTDGGLQPGTLVATLTSPSSYSTTALSAANFSTGSTSLAANTTYWLVLSAPTGAYDWAFTSDSTVTDGWGVAADAGVTWFTDDAYPLQFAVTDTVNGVPEPATAALLGLAGLPLLARRRAARR